MINLKKLLSVFLTAALVISLLPSVTLPALAATNVTISEDTTSNDTYHVSDDTTLYIAKDATYSVDIIFDNDYTLTLDGPGTLDTGDITAASDTVDISLDIDSGCLYADSIKDVGSGSTVTIDGGSVLINDLDGIQPVSGGSSVYLTTVTVGTTPAESTDVTYTVDGGSEIETKTDENGCLYLWLTAGSHTLAISDGTNNYSADVTVKSSNDNVVTAGTAASTAYVVSDSNAVTISKAGNYVISGASTLKGITVDGSITGSVNITLVDVSIDVSGTSGACAFSIGANSTVNLTITNSALSTNTLKSGANCAGLRVPSTSTLNISGSGSLTAAASNKGAGIGGDQSCANCGTVTISGGTVIATGSLQSAGIGGGENGSGGTIIISGGSVTATGGGNGAGIGGGFYGAGGTVTISGTAEVNATGGTYAAGIGVGRESTSGNGKVTINGGTVNATGGKLAAGIGGGYKAASGDITINGGTVNAIGVTSSYSTGIGGGTDTSGNVYTTSGSVTINGGKITASGNTYDIASNTVAVSADDSANPALLICGNSSAIYSAAGNTFESGSINASTVTPVPKKGTDSVYLTAVILTASAANAEVAYSTDGGTTKHYTYTDASEKLYLWLPSGDAAVQITGDGWSYQASGTVAENNSNVFSLTIVTDSLPDGVIGTAYSQTLSASGGYGSYGWTISSGALPDGLSLSSGGIISGTPTKTGKFSFTVKATDTNGTTASQALSILVSSGTSDATLCSLTLSAGTLSPSFASEAYSYAATVSNSTASLTVTPTTSYSGASVTVNGKAASTAVALSVGDNTITVQVTASGGATTKTYTITVTRQAPITITTSKLPVGIVGESYGKTLSATGGSGAYTWSWAAASGSSLPSGITLSAGGVLSVSGGTLTDSEVGSYSVEITAADSSDASTTQTQSFTLKIQKGCGNGTYMIKTDGVAAYTGSYTDDAIPTLTVNAGVTGFTYFGVDISAVNSHSGTEVCVFVQTRDGQQINISASKGDFDTLTGASAAFNVKAGDVIEVYIVDSLSNSGSSPSIL